VDQLTAGDLLEDGEELTSNIIHIIGVGAHIMAGAGWHERLAIYVITSSAYGRLSSSL